MNVPGLVPPDADVVPNEDTIAAFNAMESWHLRFLQMMYRTDLKRPLAPFAREFAIGRLGLIQSILENRNAKQE